MARTECLDYRKLPGQNPLFLDFLYSFDRVRPYYGLPVHASRDAFLERAASLLKSPPSLPRENIARIVEDFNLRIGAGQKALENVRSLRSEGCLAVVTGQQPGFLGGPALSVYKALTAVRLAAILEEAGFRAVPVFWLASDDSDFQEVCSTSFFDPGGLLCKYTYPDLREDRAQMIGTVRLTRVEEFLEQLSTTGVKGDSAAPLLRLLAEHHLPGRTFAEAMGAWLSRLFGSHGLVLFDSRSKGYRRDLEAAFSIAVQRREQIVKTLKDRETALRADGYEGQVRVESSESLLFWREGDSRYKLEHSGGHYRKKRGHPGDSRIPDLSAQLGDHLTRLVPNVLLRPILQDSLFPTVAYVGGPSEIAYSAQVNAIRPFWGQEPVVFPRAGLTLLDRRTQRLLERHGLSALEIMSGTPEEVSKRLLTRSDPGEILSRLEQTRSRMRDDLSSLQQGIQEVDPTVAEMLGGAQTKILYQIEKIEKRFLSNQQKDQKTFIQQLDYLFSRLRPEGQLQERVVNFGQFMSEEGVDLVDTLAELVDPFCLSHQLVWL